MPGAELTLVTKLLFRSLYSYIYRVRGKDAEFRLKGDSPMQLSIQYSLSEKWLPAESLEVYQDFMEPAERLKGDLIFLTAMFNF